jgi:ketosteroid isomerase-like protein
VESGGTAGEDHPVNLEQVIEAQREAMRAIAKGDPEPTKALYSEADDVTLANPWGPAVRGRAGVCEMLDFVGTRFRDGVLEGFDQLAAYVDSNIATVFENERWRVKVGGRDELSPFRLRVTCTYRREGDTWKLVSRHADPISEPRPDGPLQS